MIDKKMDRLVDHILELGSRDPIINELGSFELAGLVMVISAQDNPCCTTVNEILNNGPETETEIRVNLTLLIEKDYVECKKGAWGLTKKACRLSNIKYTGDK